MPCGRITRITVSQRVVEVAVSKLQISHCGYRYHTLLGKIISSVILLTQWWAVNLQ